MGRRGIVVLLVVGNLVVLGVLALSTYDLLAARRLVGDDVLDACLRDADVGAVALRWRDAEVIGPGAVKARADAGVVTCRVETPLRPWGPVVVESARLSPGPTGAAR